MRIIAGEFKGRPLKSFKADHIRPTTDRVKESIFNSLSADFDTPRVLDLFAGTGNLSIECISRGARHVDMVEQSRKSLQIIKQNLKLFNINDKVRVFPEDVLKYIKNYEGEGYDIVLIDPPFTKKMAHEVMQRFSENTQLVHLDTLIVIESSKHEQIEDQYGNISLKKRKDFGDKAVSFFQVDDSND